ncbi:hypothetical protein KKA03_04215 [archaeon]|nr:hypothetical protein [archaeon]
MGFGFESVVRAVFPKKKERVRLSEKVQEGTDVQEHIKRATRIIKETIKEPDELPQEGNIPAIREFLDGD